MVTYMSRAAWAPESAKLADGDSLPSRPVRGVAVHWPGTTQASIGDPGQTAIARRLRRYLAYHTGTKGWRDIGYNLAIDQGARIWRCRTRQNHGDLIGAHCATPANPDANEEYVGVLLLLGADEDPSAAMLDAWWDWYQNEFLRAYPGRTDVRGHGDVPGAQTACPGPHVPIHQLSNPPKENPMAITEDDARKVAAAFAEMLAEASYGLDGGYHENRASTLPGRHLRQSIWALLKYPIIRQIHAQSLDPAELAQHVITQLPDGRLDQATAEQAFRAVLGSLDE